jgi:type II secretory pathway component PulM
MADLELREDPDKKQTTLQNIPRGALVAILVDAASRERLWVGVAMADVARQSDTNAVRRRLDYAISGMFRGFPGK